MAKERPRPEHEVTDAIGAALPTNRHAILLFEMVAEALGERAVVETAASRTRRLLFCREAPGSTAVIPWPLLKLDTAGRTSTVIPLSGPEGDPPPRPGKAPRLQGLGPGEILLFDGPHSITVTYGEDGRWFEKSRSESPDALVGALAVLADRNAQPVELLARYMASLDIARHGPCRLLLPAPLPSIEGARNCGLFAIRDALFDGRIPETARCAVADAFDGSTLAWGERPDETLARWRTEVLRRKPRPPDPPRRRRPPEGTVPGAFTITGPSSDIPWPDATPENTPAVLIPLAPVARSPWRGASVMRLLGGFGGTIQALMRRDADGFTLVGDGLIGLVDLDGIDAMLEEVQHFDHPAIEQAREAWLGERPPYDTETTVYRLVDDSTLEPITPRVDSGSRGYGFRGRALDGDRVRFRVVRQRGLR